MDMRILRLPDVQAKTGLSRSTIYRMEADGQCPKRIKLGEHAHASGWIESEWDSWIAERIAARERAA
jgi:prophage regulatory protein